MRPLLDEQTYLDFSEDASLKVVKDYRAKYAWIDECLEANTLILWLVELEKWLVRQNLHA